jgi:hypothetical protein
VAREGLFRLSVTPVSRHRRKRRRTPTTAPAVPPRPPRRAAAVPDPDERPQTPWHPFPLVELAIFVGIVLIVVGFLTKDSTRGRTLLACGLVLGATGGLDTSVREHFAGYRSHTTVLAAFPAVAVAVVLAVAGAPTLLVPGAALIVFVAAFGALRRVWDRSAAA